MSAHSAEWRHGWVGTWIGTMWQLLTELCGLDVVWSLRGHLTLWRLGWDDLCSDRSEWKMNRKCVADIWQ